MNEEPPCPAVSVVVCTRNRAGSLADTLRHYQRISASVPWELVVVNNASTDETDQVLREFVSTSGLCVRVVAEDLVGVSRARNTGWRHARADLVAFTDDDCYPQHDYVEAIWRNFQEGNLDYLGGRVLLFDPSDWPITIQECTERGEFAAREFIESGIVLGANMAARRWLLEATRGFDPLLGPGTSLPAGEDIDFFNRASALGCRGAYDPRPVVRHHHRRRTQQEARALTRSYSIGRGAHFMKGIVDPHRRRMFLRQWYWRSMLPVFSSSAAIEKVYFEVIGALRYLRARWLGGSASSGC